MKIVLVIKSSDLQRFVFWRSSRKLGWPVGLRVVLWVGQNSANVPTSGRSDATRAAGTVGHNHHSI
jgi:hypothetical protein